MHRAVHQSSAATGHDPKAPSMLSELPFYGDELLTVRQTPKLEHRPYLTVRYTTYHCLIWRPSPPSAVWRRLNRLYTCSIYLLFYGYWTWSLFIREEHVLRCLGTKYRGKCPNLRWVQGKIRMRYLQNWEFYNVVYVLFTKYYCIGRWCGRRHMYFASRICDMHTKF